MKLRLARLDGLRLALAPGWYELPSHLADDERRRLHELLAAALGCGSIVECAWDELELLMSGDLAGALIDVSVPRGVAADARDHRLAALRPRLGLHRAEEPGRWPERAWDELEVKGALATWLRRSLRAPDHPLAGLGVASLPIDALVAATCEPIELLRLVEMTLEVAAGQRRRDGAIDWPLCVRWSLGRRLAGRLAAAAPALRPALAALIASSPEGPLPPLVDPRLLQELARLGLAHAAGGDAVLAPLARVAAEGRVRELLELEGVGAPAPAVPLLEPRTRARTPREAALAFDPLLEVGPEDPWLVDLRSVSTALRSFAERLELQVGRRDAFARIAVIQRAGSGADTMVRRLLHEARARGLVTVTLRGGRALGAADLRLADLLLATLLALLRWCDGDGVIDVPATTRGELRRWLVEIAVTEPAARDYFLLGVDVGERAGLPSLVTIAQRIADAEREGVIAAHLRGRTQELLDHLGALIDEIQGHLAGRGGRLCLRVEGLGLVDAQARLDALLVEHAAELGRLRCHWVVSAGLLAAWAPELRERFTALVFPEALAEDEAVDKVRALLAARAELPAIFADDEAQARAIAEASGGAAREVFTLARRACELADAEGDAKVGAGAVARAIGEMVAALGGLVADGTWGRLVAVHAGEPAGIADVWMIRGGLLLPREDDAGWAVLPVVRCEPLYEGARLRREGEQAHKRGEHELAERCLRDAVELAVGPQAANERVASVLALGQCLFARERFGEVIDALDPVLDELGSAEDLSEDVGALQFLMSMSLMGVGKTEEARESIEHLWNTTKAQHSPAYRAPIAFMYMLILGATGRLAEMEAIARRLQSLLSELPKRHRLREIFRQVAVQFGAAGVLPIASSAQDP